MDSDLIHSEAYQTLIAELKAKVQAAQLKAAVAVNTQLIELYWEIGRLVTERQAASGWGDKVIADIARDLGHELSGQKGFSRRNLYYMKQFFGFYAEQGQFVQQVVAQIPWGHHVILIDKVKDPAKALWYVRKTRENGWSRHVLSTTVTFL